LKFEQRKSRSGDQKVQSVKDFRNLFPRLSKNRTSCSASGSDDVLNQALEKYCPGRSEPILIGDEKLLLKPALKLMSFYRLRIDEIKADAVVTSYARRLESVQVKGTENQVVYVTFSPQFERIWLESKKRLPKFVAKEPGQHWNFGLRNLQPSRLPRTVLSSGCRGQGSCLE
jgi:hypothetical protein